MIPFKRHDLVWLSEAGRNYALRNIEYCTPLLNDSEKEKLILGTPPIPAIVRRQETPNDDFICIGFSFPKIIDGVRLRIGSRVSSDCIVTRKTPFDAVQCEKNNSDYEVLLALMEAGDNFNVQVGCFGSTALQLVTGLPYRHKDSDLDIYLCHHGNKRELELFFARLSELEGRFDVTIDAEIEYSGQYGIKLKELFAPGRTVLGKGLYDVVLFNKKDLAL